MGGSGKHKKGKRKPSSVKKSSNKSDLSVEDSTSCDLVSPNENSNSSQTSSQSISEPIYCTEDEFEALAMKKFQACYGQALAALMSYGHHCSTVMNALLTIGHGYGVKSSRKDATLKRIGYNKNDGEAKKVGHKNDLITFVSDALEGMVHNVSQARPSLTSGDLLWCLMMSNFDMSAAKTLEVPALTRDGKYRMPSGAAPRAEALPSTEGSQDRSNFEKLDNLLDENDYGDQESSKKMILAKNIANFVAVYRDNIEETREETEALKKMFPNRVPCEPIGFEDSRRVGQALQRGFRKAEDLETILRLLYEIKKFKEKVKERREWALEKVLDAIKKLGLELIQLKNLRMENREKDRIENGNNKDELENENVEIKAEIEAFKLRSSESSEKLATVLKKYKKLSKKTTALEKQNSKLQNEIREHRESFSMLQQQLIDIKKAQEDIEVLWRQEIEAKELATNQLQKEWKLKGETEVCIQMRQKELRRKTETDHQKYEDYIQFLERKIANVERPLEARDEIKNLPNFLFSWETQSSKTQGEEFKNELREPSDEIDASKNNIEVACDRPCVICMEKEASVVLLPCAHQVLCTECVEDCYHGNVEARCPCCKGLVEEKIHVYGVRS